MLRMFAALCRSFLSGISQEQNARRARSSAGPKAKAAPGWQTAGSGRSLGGAGFEDLSGGSAVNPWSQEPQEPLNDDMH